MPDMLAAPINPSLGHRYSDPFTQQSSMLTASTAPVQSRKFSSPTLAFTQTTTRPTNTLAASFSSNVSHSHPNLASLNGSNMQPFSTALESGWRGFRGSASHNTSPRRSPSPTPMPHSSSSMGNIAQHQQPNRFDPFQQFTLNSVVGGTGGATASQAGTAPAPANGRTTTQTAKPSCQPYYMQSQPQHRNGLQQPAASQNQSNKQGAQNGSKTKATSAFRTIRPHSPNYNPSLFSTVGNKTGI